MKKHRFLFACLFILGALLPYWSMAQNVALNPVFDYGKGKQLKLHFPNQASDCSKANVPLNRYAMIVYGGSALVGTTCWLISKKTYNDYKSYKNQILYDANVNSFQNADLQQFENERNRLFEKANQQRKIGNWLTFAGGFGVLSLHVVITKASGRKQPFRFKICAG